MLKTTHVVALRVLLRGHLDTVGDEAKHSTDPQQQGEATEELFAKLHPFGRRFRRCQLVRTIAVIANASLLLGEALLAIGTEGDTQFLKRNAVLRHLQLLLQLIEILLPLLPLAFFATTSGDTITIASLQMEKKNINNIFYEVSKLNGFEKNNNITKTTQMVRNTNSQTH